VTELQFEGQNKRNSLKYYAVSPSLTIDSQILVRIPSHKSAPPQYDLLPRRQLTLALSNRSFKPQRAIVNVSTISVTKYFVCLLLSTKMWSKAGMATVRGMSNCALEQVCCLRSLCGWLVGSCEAAFCVQEAKDMGQGRSELFT